MTMRRFLLILLVGVSFLNIILYSCTKENDPLASSTIEEIPGADGIYLHQEYQMGVGGYWQSVYEPYLLFKDGSIYKNLNTTIDKLDEAQSKQNEPHHWGTWEKKGNEFIVVWNNGNKHTWEEETWFTTDKARKGEQLADMYESVTGGGNTAFGGSVITFSASTISFDGNKFTFETTTGGTSSAATAYSSQEKAGTYELDGHSITLRFNNGAVEKKFFYFYPDSKHVFGIGTRYYVGKK